MASILHQNKLMPFRLCIEKNVTTLPNVHSKNVKNILQDDYDYEITGVFQRSLDMRPASNLVLLNFSKAFDSSDNDLIIKKLMGNSIFQRQWLQ